MTTINEKQKHQTNLALHKPAQPLIGHHFVLGPTQSTNETVTKIVLNGETNTLTTSADIMGYWVYRSSEVGTNYTRVLAVPAAATNAVVKNLIGPTHFFFIQATNYNSESGPSNVVAPSAQNPQRIEKLKIPVPK